MRTLGVVILAAAVSAARAAHVVLDFDSAMSIETTGPFHSITELESSAFVLFAAAAAGGVGMNLQTGGTCWPDNGTASLSVPDYSAPVLRRTSGAPFTLLKLDVAEFSCVYTGPQVIRLIAGFSDGRSVIWDFQTDGLAANTGALSDYQTIDLPASFSGSVWVKFEGNMSLDNLHLDAPVPEPCPVVLLAVIVLNCRRRRRIFR